MDQKRKRLLFVFGTRPEALKLAPILDRVRRCYAETFVVETCVTGQHQEMLDQVLELFNIRPDYDLNIMESDQKLERVTANILLGLSPILTEFKPDCVLVQGDTNTTLSAALTSYYHGVPVAHVEAGLRTNDIYNPWPEEINRQVVSRIATFHFAPTEVSRTNLARENITENVFVVGNSIVDALFFTIEKMNDDTQLTTSLRQSLETQGINFDKKIILVTAHRRESFGQGLASICDALRQIALSFPDVQLIYPVHLNPHVRETVMARLGNAPNVILMEPQDYQTFVFLMQRAFMILTDSGGIQEEAVSISKPVLVMRKVTERVEAVEEGTAKIVGIQITTIVESVRELLTNPEAYHAMVKTGKPYGKGTTSKLILDCLAQRL